MEQDISPPLETLPGLAAVKRDREITGCRVVAMLSTAPAGSPRAALRYWIIGSVMIELEWLPAPKVREYYVDPAAGDTQEAQRVLYLAVATGQVRARSKGRVLRLNQIALMEQINPFSLPPDLELSIEDAHRKWGGP
jgi:hypothetical protein